MLSRSKWVSSFLMGFYLAACTSMPLASMAKLSAIDMGRTPPDQLRVAFIAPEAIKVRSGDMVMKVHLKLADGSFESTRNLSLLEDNSQPPASLTSLAGSGQTIYIMKLEEADAKAYRKLQDVLRESQAAGTRKKGSLEISFASQACAVRPFNGPLLVSASIKTAELDDYTVLFRNIDLATMARQAGQSPEVKPCA